MNDTILVIIDRYNGIVLPNIPQIMEYLPYIKTVNLDTNYDGVINEITEKMIKVSFKFINGFDITEKGEKDAFIKKMKQDKAQMLKSIEEIDKELNKEVKI